MAKAQKGRRPLGRAQSTALSQRLCGCTIGCETPHPVEANPAWGTICQAYSEGIFLGTPRSESSTMPGRDSSMDAICFLTQCLKSPFSKGPQITFL